MTAIGGVRQNTAARTGVRQRQDVRNQRIVASTERPLILMERNAMVRRVANHAACFRIQVPSKALSGASVETRISRVRRSSFAADVSLVKERSRGDGACGNGYAKADDRG